MSGDHGKVYAKGLCFEAALNGGLTFIRVESISRELVLVILIERSPELNTMS